MTMDERVEAAGKRMTDAGLPDVAAALLRTAFPELFDGSAWIAPWEATAEMCEAGPAMRLVPPITTTQADYAFAAMRSVHLKPNAQTPSVFAPPQCPKCGAPTKDGFYRNIALIDETAKRLEAERKLAAHLKANAPQG